MPIDDAKMPKQLSPRVSSKLELDQLRLALCNSQPNAWMLPCCAAIMCLMFSHWIAWPALLEWFVAVTLGGLPLGYVGTKFLAASEDHLNARDWNRSAVTAYSLSAMSWASMGFFLWVPNDDLNHMIIFLVIACSLAATAALIGACRPMLIVGLAIYGVAIVGYPLRQGGVIYEGLSLLALFYTAYLANLSRLFYATARDMLMLRDDKNELIAALAKSTTESDEARLRAEAANRTKSEFLANMSHELRTPLNAIIGFSDMISSGIFVEKNLEYSGLINDSGLHLLTLINDILDLAKIEAGRLTLRETDVDLRLLIADCIALMGTKARTGGLELTALFAPDLPHVFADDRALRQVILNLLSNAMKFTPAGGRVDVETVLQSDGTIAIAVSDTGTGIAVEDLQRVFENFGQGRHDVVSKDRGTGLGLPIVKGLVAAHGGSIALQSHVGIGTVLTIILPAERARTTQPLKAAS